MDVLSLPDDDAPRCVLGQSVGCRSVGEDKKIVRQQAGQNDSKLVKESGVWDNKPSSRKGW
jgi:hypothetical protein